MNVRECENYYKSVTETGKDWVMGAGTTINAEELTILADFYGVKLPVCMHHFISSDKPGECKATGAFKTIIKVLDKLAEAIKENKQVKPTREKRNEVYDAVKEINKKFLKSLQNPENTIEKLEEIKNEDHKIAERVVESLYKYYDIKAEISPETNEIILNEVR